MKNNRSTLWAMVAMSLSMLGLIYHNVQEFGWAALLSIGTGSIPMILIGVVIVGVWWQVPSAQRIAAILMIGYGIINLVAGGIISVLPLGFLPFEPEQSLLHYMSHLFYSLSQPPLIWFGFRQLLTRRPTQVQETTRTQP